MFGWALIIEQVFNVPGMSRALLNAISQRDFLLLQGSSSCSRRSSLLANLSPTSSIARSTHASGSAHEGFVDGGA